MSVPWSTVVNSIGLLLDICGGYLIYRYGLPKWVPRDGEDFIIDGGNLDAPSEPDEPDTYTRNARIGLVFLIAGFIFQLVSNFLR
jgi:hypothetical protein